MHTAGIFLEYVKTYLKTRLTYRSDFWVEVVSDILSLAVNFVFILVIFQHTQLLDGWTREQIVFIYGFFMVPWGVFYTLFHLPSFAERYIVKGEMDRVLTRPVHNLAQILLENLDPASLVNSLIGVAIMAYAWPSLGVRLDWYDPFIFALFVVGAVMVYSGIYISLLAISFFSDSPTGILPMISNIQAYGRYPVTIYNQLLRFVLTWVLPFAFVGFYPAVFFLETEGLIGFSLLTPLVGAAALAVGLTVWNVGVRRYRGAGS